MTGTGRPPAATVRTRGLRLAIVATRWNAEVVDALADRALAAGRASDARVTPVIRVTGALELPIVVQAVAGTHDAVVALGAVIRGDTPHFDYVCQAVGIGLGRVALDEQTPVGNGVLTCDTLKQAVDRCGLPDSSQDKGWEATVAALDTALTLRDLRHRRHDEHGD